MPFRRAFRHLQRWSALAQCLGSLRIVPNPVEAGGVGVPDQALGFAVPFNSACWGGAPPPPSGQRSRWGADHGSKSGRVIVSGVETSLSTAPQKDFPENETCVRHSGGGVQTTAFPMVKGDGGTLTISTRTTSLYQPYEQRIRPQRAVGTHTRGKQELLQCADGGEHEGVGGKADGQLRKRLHSCNAIIGCVSVSTENSHPSDISFFYMIIHIITTYT